MVTTLSLLVLNPVLQLSNIFPDLLCLCKMPVITCQEVYSVVIIDGPKHVTNNGVPAFSYRCVPRSPFHLDR